jgi:hypothetical protein
MGMISSENRYPPRFKCGAGFFRIMPDQTGLRRGRNRIDEGVKGVFFLGMVPPISGHAIVANDNYAPVAQAA